MSIGEGGTSTSHWFVTTISHPRVEMGDHISRLHLWLTSHQEATRSIMVVVDKLKKTTHFIPMKSTYKTMEIANISMREIFHLHEIPTVVIHDRDVKFTFTFWKTLFL